MKTTEILKKIFKDKNLSLETQRSYISAITFFENNMNMKLHEFLEIVNTEDENRVRWKDSQLKELLNEFRQKLNAEYATSTANTYYSKIIAILNHFEYTYGKIPTKKGKKYNLRDISEIISQEELRECIHQPNTEIIEPYTKLGSSTALLPAEILEFTVLYWLQITKQYHNYFEHNNIKKALLEMNESEELIVPTLKGWRKKTGVQYITFASPEAVKSVNIMLLGREHLKPDSKLFDITHASLGRSFKTINEKLSLGVDKHGYSRFNMKNLREFHNTQLERAGMQDARINILSGRENQTVIRKHYIDVDSNSLKEEYIKCLPFLLIEETNQVKSELDNVKEELEVKTAENKQLTDNLNNIWDEIHDMKNRQEAWEQIKNENYE